MGADVGHDDQLLTDREAVGTEEQPIAHAPEPLALRRVTCHSSRPGLADPQLARGVVDDIPRSGEALDANRARALRVDVHDSAPTDAVSTVLRDPQSAVGLDVHPGGRLDPTVVGAVQTEGRSLGTGAFVLGREAREGGEEDGQEGARHGVQGIRSGRARNPRFRPWPGFRRPGASSGPRWTTLCPMAAQKKRPSTSLFDEIVFASDRERIPGARPIVSWDSDDEPDYLAAIEEFAGERIELRRRGHEHGSWAELDLTSSGVLSPSADLRGADLVERWQASRPILFPGVLGEVPAEELEAGLDLGQSLQREGGLAAHLAGRELPAQLTLVEHEEPQDERVHEAFYFEGPGESPLTWAKSARLSTAEEDSSMRLRVSFGREVEDDASRDLESHRRVSALAEALLPGAAFVDQHPGPRVLLAEWLGVEPLLTQHIAYWNAPGGGALMHHDAFAEDEGGVGQLGVVYAQLAGRTAWLALSLDDLALRVEDYCEHLEEDGSEWVRKSIWPDRRDFERVLARVRNPQALRQELVLPGCGKLGPLVNYGPDFTSFLADAGHALLVRPGDLLFLPGGELTRCVMHSVFCASPETTYALSIGVRADGEKVPPVEDQEG